MSQHEMEKMENDEDEEEEWMDLEGPSSSRAFHLPEPDPQRKEQDLEVLIMHRETPNDRRYLFVPKPREVLPTNPLPQWQALPLDRKIPMVPAPRGTFINARAGISTPLHLLKNSSFDTSDPYMHETPTEYNALHDPHLKYYFQTQQWVVKRLIQLGLLTPNGQVTCNLAELNRYRVYLGRVHRLHLTAKLKKDQDWNSCKKKQEKKIREVVLKQVRQKRDDMRLLRRISVLRENERRAALLRSNWANHPSNAIAEKRAKELLELKQRRELKRIRVALRLNALREAQRRRSEQIMMHVVCEEDFSEKLRNYLRKEKALNQEADLKNFVENKRRYQEQKLRYHRALMRRDLLERKCGVEHRYIHYQMANEKNKELRLKKAIRIKKKREREMYLMNKYASHWRYVTLKGQQNGAYGSAWRIRSTLQEGNKHLKSLTKEVVSFSTMLESLFLGVKHRRVDPLKDADEETTAVVQEVMKELMNSTYTKLISHLSHCLVDYAVEEAGKRILDYVCRERIDPQDLNHPVVPVMRKNQIRLEPPQRPCCGPCAQFGRGEAWIRKCAKMNKELENVQKELKTHLRKKMHGDLKKALKDDDDWNKLRQGISTIEDSSDMNTAIDTVAGISMDRASENPANPKMQKEFVDFAANRIVKSITAAKAEPKGHKDAKSSPSKKSSSPKSQPETKPPKAATKASTPGTPRKDQAQPRPSGIRKSVRGDEPSSTEATSSDGEDDVEMKTPEVLSEDSTGDARRPSKNLIESPTEDSSRKDVAPDSSKKDENQESPKRSSSRTPSMKDTTSSPIQEPETFVPGVEVDSSGTKSPADKEDLFAEPPSKPETAGSPSAEIRSEDGDDRVLTPSRKGSAPSPQVGKQDGTPSSSTEDQTQPPLGKRKSTPSARPETLTENLPQTEKETGSKIPETSWKDTKDDAPGPVGIKSPASPSPKASDELSSSSPETPPSSKTEATVPSDKSERSKRSFPQNEEDVGIKAPETPSPKASDEIPDSSLNTETPPPSKAQEPFPESESEISDESFLETEEDTEATTPETGSRKGSEKPPSSSSKTTTSPLPETQEFPPEDKSDFSDESFSENEEDIGTPIPETASRKESDKPPKTQDFIPEEESEVSEESYSEYEEDVGIKSPENSSRRGSDKDPSSSPKAEAPPESTTPASVPVDETEVWKENILAEEEDAGIKSPETPTQKGSDKRPSSSPQAGSPTASTVVTSAPLEEPDTQPERRKSSEVKTRDDTLGDESEEIPSPSSLSRHVIEDSPEKGAAQPQEAHEEEPEAEKEPLRDEDGGIKTPETDSRRSTPDLRPRDSAGDWTKCVSERASGVVREALCNACGKLHNVPLSRTPSGNLVCDETQNLESVASGIANKAVEQAFILRALKTCAEADIAKARGMDRSDATDWSECISSRASDVVQAAICAACNKVNPLNEARDQVEICVDNAASDIANKAIEQSYLHHATENSTKGDKTRFGDQKKIGLDDLSECVSAKASDVVEAAIDAAYGKFRPHHIPGDQPEVYVETAADDITSRALRKASLKTFKPTETRKSRVSIAPGVFIKDFESTQLNSPSVNIQIPIEETSMDSSNAEIILSPRLLPTMSNIGRELTPSEVYDMTYHDFESSASMQGITSGHARLDVHEGRTRVFPSYTPSRFTQPTQPSQQTPSYEFRHPGNIFPTEVRTQVRDQLRLIRAEVDQLTQTLRQAGVLQDPPNPPPPNQ